jgi:thiol-disulfide isomerase/thioredoxin
MGRPAARRPAHRASSKMLDTYRWLALGLGAVLAAGLLFGHLTRGAVLATVPAGPSLPLSSYGQAPEFTGIVDWENSAPLTMAQLRGKVVVVDFWTYSCINCQRTLPFVAQWDRKYRDQGLVIVGVHSPEFDFEKDLGNIRQAIHQYGVVWPVAVDSNMKTWDAYNNAYWPAFYLVDRSGRIRYVHFGEGEYDRTDAAIRALLKEGSATGASALVGGRPPSGS